MKHTLQTILHLGLLLGVLAPPSLTAASLGVAAKAAHEQFVRDEALTISLYVKNFGESAFIIDDYGDYQKNKIEIFLRHTRDGFLTIRKGVPFGSAMVMPGEAETFSVDLQKWFDNLKEGSYFVQIVVHRGEEKVATNLVKFDIVAGMEIGSTTRPVSGNDALSRTYTLLYWPREQVEILFMRVTEPPNDRVVGMVRLGNVLRYEAPKIEFESNGRLIVTHQTTRDILVRTTIRSTLSTLDIVKSERVFYKGPGRN